MKPISSTQIPTHPSIYDLLNPTISIAQKIVSNFKETNIPLLPKGEKTYEHNVINMLFDKITPRMLIQAVPDDPFDFLCNPELKKNFLQHSSQICNINYKKASKFQPKMAFILNKDQSLTIRKDSCCNELRFGRREIETIELYGACGVLVDCTMRNTETISRKIYDFCKYFLVILEEDFVKNNSNSYAIIHVFDHGITSISAFDKAMHDFHTSNPDDIIVTNLMDLYSNGVIELMNSKKEIRSIKYYQIRFPNSDDSESLSMKYKSLESSKDNSENSSSKSQTNKDLYSKINDLTKHFENLDKEGASKAEVNAIKEKVNIVEEKVNDIKGEIMKMNQQMSQQMKMIRHIVAALMPESQIKTDSESDLQNIPIKAEFFGMSKKGKVEDDIQISSAAQGTRKVINNKTESAEMQPENLKKQLSGEVIFDIPAQLKSKGIKNKAEIQNKLGSKELKKEASSLRETKSKIIQMPASETINEN